MIKISRNLQNIVQNMQVDSTAGSVLFKGKILIVTLVKKKAEKHQDKQETACPIIISEQSLYSSFLTSAIHIICPLYP